MTVSAVRRATAPGTLELGQGEDVARSAAVLEAGGARVIPLLKPVGQFPILAVTPHGLLLCAVVAGDWPEPLGATFPLPGSFPPTTRRLIHRWPTSAILPDVLSL